MYNRKLVTLVLPALIPAVAAAALTLSPYRYSPAADRALLKESIDIRAACAAVFAYLGDSANASAWSVFVDHITPLNAERVPDGALGSIRRSFRNADETGMRWDEDFTIVEQNRRRQLRIYNVEGAPLRAAGELFTEQVYEALDDSRCRLSFTLFFGDEPRGGDVLRMRLAAYPIAAIFRGNLENVGLMVEAR